MIFSLVAMSALSQVSSGRPTLIVGISIDQLRGDYLDLLQSQFGNGGFKRLMAEGAHLDNVVFDMAQLDKTFPTLDCAACILTPKMVDCAQNEKIHIIFNLL